MKFENTLRFTSFPDTVQVKQCTEYYDTLILKSHLLAGGDKSIPSLIKKLVEEKNLEFYIDPVLPEFRKGDHFRTENGELKSWHADLVEWYGSPLKEILEKERNLNPLIISASTRKEIVESMCNFQENFIRRKIEGELGKYMTVESVEGLMPKAIIPWYTKIQNRQQLDINKKLIEDSTREASLPLKPCLHVSKNFISSMENQKNLLQLLKNFKIEEFFLWIDNLDKHETTKEEYVNTIKFIILLSEHNIRPHFMYGDYFGNLLYFFGLKGISYATYHSESKKEKISSSTGGQLTRYYIDPIKDFMTIPYAVRALKANKEPLCSCKSCQNQLKNWDDLYEFSEDHNNLKNHFVQVKDRQKQKILSENLGTLLSELTENRKKYKKVYNSCYDRKGISYLKHWVKSIKEILEELNQEKKSFRHS